MKTETIEWFTPEEKLPKDPSYMLLVKFQWEIELDWGFSGSTWETAGGCKCAAPDFWAYNPKGPQ
jgi:hypothetical protein